VPDRLRLGGLTCHQCLIKPRCYFPYPGPALGDRSRSGPGPCRSRPCLSVEGPAGVEVPFTLPHHDGRSVRVPWGLRLGTSHPSLPVSTSESSSAAPCFRSYITLHDQSSDLIPDLSARDFNLLKAWTSWTEAISEAPTRSVLLGPLKRTGTTDTAQVPRD
jgi:hypothetical protein